MASGRQGRDDGRFDLRYGPYQSPRVRRGGRLFCERFGTVQVCRFSDGPITWPMCTVGERGGPAFVLCGDLVRAIRTESATAVARAWGVHPATVSDWRRVLGVERFNPGTHAVFVAHVGKGLTAEVTAEGRALQTPERQLEWAAARVAEGRTRKRTWTPDEDRLLGTTSDAELGRRLGCSASTVAIRRRELGVPAARPARLRQRADLVRYSPAKLQTRRLELGLFQTRVAERCGWRATRSYQRLEEGLLHYVTPRVLASVARALECEPGDLVET